MEHRVNVYLGEDNIISSLGFTTQENLEAIQNYRTGIVHHTSSDIADTPIQAALIDPIKLGEQVKQYQLEEYTKIEQLFILSIQQVLEESKTLITDPTCCLLFFHNER